MARSPARRRPVRKRLGYADGRWEMMGPLRRDENTGFLYPEEVMIQQDGKWVHRDYKRGGRDRPPDY